MAWISPRKTPGGSNGVPVAVDGGSFATTTTLYGQGRLWIVKGNNAQQITVTRDGNGNGSIAARTDVAGRQTAYANDARNRPDSKRPAAAP